MNMNAVHTQGKEVLNRHDFWRACYATMLAEIRLEDIVEFFEKIPMVMEGKRYDVRDLLALFWNEKGNVNMDWNFHSIHPIESFLVEKGYDALGFFRKMLHRNNRATYMPGKVVLNWFYPFMDKLLITYDPREMVLKLMTIYAENYVPGIIYKRIKKTLDGEWIQSYMLLITHKTFNDCYVFNYDFIVGEQIRAFPKMMNLSEFDSIFMLGDCQRIEDVLWCTGIERNESGIWLDGRQIAACDHYHAFMERGGFDIEKFNIPDRAIMVATEDIVCPKRKRQVIYKGCAYEAPAYLCMIRHKKVSNRERKLLQHMLKDTMLEDELFSPEVCRNHEKLMKSLEKKFAFTYFPMDETISINGEHFVKGIQAKILRRLIGDYLKDGRCDFEYREFKRDFDISLGQKNSNFEVRFYRLIEKLEEKCPSIVVAKNGRGRFSLMVTAKLSLEE